LLFIHETYMYICTDRETERRRETRDDKCIEQAVWHHGTRDSGKGTRENTAMTEHTIRKRKVIK
jgi:hypothetical protein